MKEYVSAAIAAYETGYAKGMQDALESIGRCKDCKYWERDWDPSGANDGTHYCAMIDNNPGPNCFCYLGENVDLEENRK